MAVKYTGLALLGFLAVASACSGNASLTEATTVPVSTTGTMTSVSTPPATSAMLTTTSAPPSSTTTVSTTPFTTTPATSTPIITSTSPSTTPATTSLYTVIVQNQAYETQNLTVPAGTKVTWINKDADAHTATSDPGSPEAFDVILGGNGGSGSYTFTRPGTYAYHCTYHSDMHAFVTVTP
jgi:plastocyanin